MQHTAIIFMLEGVKTLNKNNKKQKNYIDSFALIFVERCTRILPTGLEKGLTGNLPAFSLCLQEDRVRCCCS